MRWLWGEWGAGRIDVVIRGAGVLVVAGVLAGGGAYVIGGGEEDAEANAWVDTTAQACTRQASPVTYEEAEANGWVCGTFSAAYSAASGGDTIRAKAGNYPASDSVGGSKTPVINVYGEDGTVIVSGRDSSGSSLEGFSLSGNVTVSNVDVGGPEPFIFIGGDNSTWRDSTLLESSDSNSYPGARGSATGGTPEPILIYNDNEGDPNENLSIINVVVEPQHICTPSVGTCGPGDVYHLESIRIDQNVHNVLIDSVTFEDGGEDGTSLIFITKVSGTLPSNITIQNSTFGEHDGDYNIDGGGNTVCLDYVIAYNTFSKQTLWSCTSGSDIEFVGNIGPFASFGGCPTGGTYHDNLWQWSSDPRHCTGQVANDDWEAGTNFGIEALGLDANYRLEAGSPAINAAETPGASDYCTGALGSADIDGDTRPAGSVCDAGADERE
jgi:hypothetical protein